MADDRKISPAYVSFQTFKSTIKAMAQDGDPPARVDNTVLPSMSGSARAQFIGALRFLGLVDADNKPRGWMSALCGGDENEWRVALGKVLNEKYPDQLDALKSGTAGTFKESFGDIPTSLIVPAARFLLAAARDAGLPVSKHINEIAGGARSARRAAPKDTNGKLPNGVEIKPPPHTDGSFMDKLLAKFPAFDPEWDEPKQAAWFSAFNKFMAMTGEGGRNE